MIGLQKPVKTRSTGDATIFRELLDNDRLRDLDKGVNYFLQMMRPHFVKGAQNVFLYRVLKFFKHGRGHQEFVTFISKFEILLRRLPASWMDTMPAPELTQELHDNLADYNRVGKDRARAVHAHWMAECNTAAVAGRPPPERPPESYWTDRIHESQDILDKWLKICQDRRMVLLRFNRQFHCAVLYHPVRAM